MTRPDQSEGACHPGTLPLDARAAVGALFAELEADMVAELARTIEYLGAIKQALEDVV